MKDKGKILIIVSFWLTVSLLAILAFAGIIAPRQAISKNSRLELVRPVSGPAGENLQLKLNLANDMEDLHASLNLDLGNRHAILDEIDLPGNLEKVVIDRQRQLAFLANSFAGLQIIDISDPGNNRLVGAIDIPGHAWDIKLRGDILFLAAAQGGLRIIDVSNPANPRFISELILPGSPLLKLAIYQNTIYATSGSKGLQIIDISDLKYPQFVARVKNSAEAWGLTRTGNHLYVSTGRYRLDVFDLRNPREPVRTEQLSLPGMVQEMAVRDGYLFAPTREGGLLVFDIGDREHPARIATAYPDDSVETISIEGSKALLANRTGELFVYDLTNPVVPEKVLVTDLFFKPRNIALHNNNLYVAGGLSGLKVIDLEKISRKKLLNAFNVPGNLHRIIADDGYYYLATKNNGLYVARKQQEGKLPVIVAHLKLPKEFQNMVRSGDYLYLAYRKEGVLVADISRPERPAIVSKLNHPGRYIDIAMGGNRLYITSAGGELLIVNATFPENLILTGHLELPGPEQLAVRDNRVYVASTGGLHIIDVSNPSRPIEISNKSLPWPLQEFAKSHQMTVRGDSVFLAAGPAALIHYDIADENHPDIAEIIHIAGETQAVSTYRDQLLATTRQGRLWILQKGKQGYTHMAVSDILASCNQVTVQDGQIVLANGLKGLAFLQRPVPLKVSRPSSVRQATEATIAIPPLQQAAVYNLAVFNQREFTEIIGAVKIKD